MVEYKFTKPCITKGCDRRVYVGIKRGHKELCFTCWAQKYPAEFKEYTNGMIVRESEKKIGVGRRRSRKKSR